MLEAAQRLLDVLDAGLGGLTNKGVEHVDMKLLLDTGSVTAGHAANYSPDSAANTIAVGSITSN